MSNATFNIKINAVGELPIGWQFDIDLGELSFYHESHKPLCEALREVAFR